MQVQLTTRDVGERTVLHVAGELDVASSGRVREQVALLLSEGRTDLVVDLTDVTFLDSTGLGLMVGTLKRVRLAGGRLVLVVPSESVLKVFRVTGLDQVLTLHDSLEDALRD